MGMNLSSKEQLLKRYLNNECSPGEAKKVINWLSTPEGKRFAEKQFDEDVTNIYSGRLTFSDGPVRSVKMFQQVLKGIDISDTRKTIRFYNQNWVKIAAAILIPLLIINSIVWVALQKPGQKTEWKEVYVPRGEKLQMMFQDGTKVWLNSDTKLEYPLTFRRKGREVKLEGEAYFAVQSNKKRPFKIGLDGMNIMVTGTSFNVKAYYNDSIITTTLDEGQIYLQTLKENEGADYLLGPGQQAQFIKSDFSVEVSSSEVGQNSSWRRNELVFTDSPLREIVKVLERWYDVKFVIEPDLPDYSYTIGFNNENLEDVLFGLEALTPIDCDYKNGKVKITRRNY